MPPVQAGLLQVAHIVFPRALVRVFLPAGALCVLGDVFVAELVEREFLGTDEALAFVALLGPRVLVFRDQLPMVGDPVARAGQVESRIGPQRERHGFREQGRPVFEQEAL
jgi:hypothetical protein